MAKYSSIDQLAALMIPEVQRIFLEVMQDVVDRAMLGEMIAAIEANDPERLFRATGFSTAALGPIIDAVEQIYRDSGTVTADGFPSRIRTSTGMAIFRFDTRNPRAEEDLRTTSSQLITRLTEEARQNVRNALQQGIIEGRSPRETALDIVGRVDPKTKKRTGGLIGLTTPQERTVANVTQYLVQLDPKYLKLKLRDKRFDSIVKKAIESGTPLSGDDITRLVMRYKDRALKYRADSIARTETIQSINRGEFNANMQLVEQGLIRQSAITKEWDDVGDGKVRSSHRALAKKYGKGKGIDIGAPFVTSKGAQLMYPGDSTLGAPAEEIVHCRCRMKTVVDWFDGVE